MMIQTLSVIGLRGFKDFDDALITSSAPKLLISFVNEGALIFYRFENDFENDNGGAVERN